jgi:hypothetical protein
LSASDEPDPALNGLTVWDFYVGPALHDQAVVPFSIAMDLAVEDALQAGDPILWSIILSTIDKAVRAG